jgi:hypothetical protein
MAAAAAAHRHQEQLREPGATATDTITLPESSSTDDSVVGTASSHGIDAASTAAAAVPEFLPPMGESLRLEVEQRIRDHALNQVSCFKNLVYLEATSRIKLLPPPPKKKGVLQWAFLLILRYPHINIFFLLVSFTSISIFSLSFTFPFHPLSNKMKGSQRLLL